MTQVASLALEKVGGGWRNG